MNTTAAPTTPGVYYGLSNEAYQRIDALGSTGLKKLARSPYHFYATTLDPSRPPASEPSPAMRAGTLAHCVILEPDQIPARYVIVPEAAPRKPTSVQRKAKKPSPDTLAAIDWWDTFQLEHTGKEGIDADQLLTAQRQAASIRGLAEIAALLADGRAETSVLWHDPETGVLCKCRPDWVAPAGDDGVVIVDIKTAQSAAPDEFARSIAKFGYHLQASQYVAGVEKATGKMVLGFVLAIAESDWPHAAAAYMIDDESMEKARVERTRLTAVYAECRRTGIWTGYANTIQPIALPHWYQST